MKFRVVKRAGDGLFYPERLSWCGWTPARYFAALMCETPARYETMEEAISAIEEHYPRKRDEVVWTSP